MGAAMASLCLPISPPIPPLGSRQGPTAIDFQETWVERKTSLALSLFELSAPSKVCTHSPLLNGDAGLSSTSTHFFPVSSIKRTKQMDRGPPFCSNKLSKREKWREREERGGKTFKSIWVFQLFMADHLPSLEHRTPFSSVSDLLNHPHGPLRFSQDSVLKSGPLIRKLHHWPSPPKWYLLEEWVGIESKNWPASETVQTGSRGGMWERSTWTSWCDCSAKKETCLTLSLLFFLSSLTA